MSSNTLLLDIMVDGHFYCQLPYADKPEYTDTELKDYIESKRPNLKNKKYRIEFSNQKV